MYSSVIPALFEFFTFHIILRGRTANVMRRTHSPEDLNQADPFSAQ